MKVLPIFAILFNKNFEHLLLDVLKEVSNTSDSLCLSSMFYFESLQNYYSKEMESPLYKIYTFSKSLMKDTDILNIKLQTMNIESKFSIDNKRTFNIDPGYIDKQHLILASSKERGARIHIGQNIFLEMEYIYIFKEFKSFYWTYGDYRDKDVKKFFDEARKYYLKLL